VTRTEGATMVARRLAQRVEAVAPKGLGTWGPAWELVAEPSVMFLDALHRWEAATDPSPDGEEALRDDVRVAGNAVVEAWREAARRWDAAGRPGAPVRPETVEAGR
jgi:hypothetical protein